MIAAQFRRLGGRDFWEMKPLLLPTDSGAVKARRILAKLIQGEQTDSVDRAVQAMARNTSVQELSEQSD
jgi:vanillate O-demethylase monooxygenase subunit